MQIGIIGGGRWAMTIAQVLCTLPKRPDRVVMYTVHDRSAAFSSRRGAVLIEKPMAFPSDRIEKLCETAEQSGAMLASSGGTSCRGKIL